jgi:hypothetical protein
VIDDWGHTPRSFSIPPQWAVKAMNRAAADRVVTRSA